MAKKTIYRAIVIQGIVHGGGGSQMGNWRRSYVAANQDLEVMSAEAHFMGDSYTGVEAVQLDESRAWQVLHEQGR